MYYLTKMHHVVILLAQNYCVPNVIADGSDDDDFGNFVHNFWQGFDNLESLLAKGKNTQFKITWTAPIQKGWLVNPLLSKEKRISLIKYDDEQAAVLNWPIDCSNLSLILSGTQWEKLVMPLILV